MRALAFIFLSATCYSVYAQKLPNVQQVGLRAPENVKVDGKITEWGEQLQAYNKGTEIYYTIANNADYLYLTVKATDVGIIDKIIAGGLAFKINTTNKKDKNGAVVTFPAYEKGKTHPYLVLGKIKDVKSNAANYTTLTDSLISTANQKIKTAFKFIGTSGLKDIAEEIIPVYNAEGMLAAAMLGDDLHYNFELAIPLKLLAHSSTLKSFSYNIQLNGYAFGGTDLKLVRDRFLTFTGSDGKSYMMDDASPRSWSLASPTDFWGEYTLAKFK